MRDTEDAGKWLQLPPLSASRYGRILPAPGTSSCWLHKGGKRFLDCAFDHLHFIGVVPSEAWRPAMAASAAAAAAAPSSFLPASSFSAACTRHGYGADAAQNYAGAAYGIVFHLQHRCNTGQGKVPGSARTQFCGKNSLLFPAVGGICISVTISPGNKDVLLIDEFVRADKEVVDLDRPASRRPGNPELGLQRNQGHGHIRRMHEETGPAAENGVILILSGHRVAGGAALLEALKVAAEIPAARPLAEIASQGALLPDLRACRQPPRPAPAPHIFPRADALAAISASVVSAPIFTPPSGLGGYPLQLLEAADADDFINLEDFIARASEKIGAARVQPGAFGAQRFDCLRE